jgi:hypothetical protein
VTGPAGAPAGRCESLCPLSRFARSGHPGAARQCHVAVLRDRACGRPCGALRIPLPALVEVCAGVTDSLHPGGARTG